jgi:rRNA maturation endonuclease Nob1
VRCWRCGCDIDDEDQLDCDECGAPLVLEDADDFDADELGLDPEREYD